MRAKDLKCTIAWSCLWVYHLLKSSYFAMSDWAKFGGCWIANCHATVPPATHFASQIEHCAYKIVETLIWLGAFHTWCRKFRMSYHLRDSLPIYKSSHVCNVRHKPLPVFAYLVRLKVFTMIKFNFNRNYITRRFVNQMLFISWFSDQTLKALRSCRRLNWVTWELKLIRVLCHLSIGWRTF